MCQLILTKSVFNSPACKVADQYKLVYDNQKIVCCGLYMNVQGNLYIGHCEVMDRETVETFPIICKAGDSIWDSLIKYNEDKLPCKQCMELIHQKAKATDNLNSLDKIAFDACNDAVDELTKHAAKIIHEQWLNGVETVLTIQKSQFQNSFEQMVKSNPLSAKLLLSVAERECICDSDYLKELREEFFPKGFDLKKDLQDHYKQTTKQLRKIIKGALNKYWHDVLMETATPETIAAISNDEEIKLIKESIKIGERLIQLFPDNSTYQKILESDKRSLLSRELEILRESNEHKPVL